MILINHRATLLHRSWLNWAGEGNSEVIELHNVVIWQFFWNFEIEFVVSKNYVHRFVSVFIKSLKSINKIDVTYFSPYL